MSGNIPPPQDGGTANFKQSSTHGGFSVCITAPVALLAAIPIWTLTAVFVFDLLSDSRKRIIGALSP